MWDVLFSLCLDDSDSDVSMSPSKIKSEPTSSSSSDITDTAPEFTIKSSNEKARVDTSNWPLLLKVCIQSCFMPNVWMLWLRLWRAQQSHCDAKIIFMCPSSPTPLHTPHRPRLVTHCILYVLSAHPRPPRNWMDLLLKAHTMHILTSIAYDICRMRCVYVEEREQSDRVSFVLVSIVCFPYQSQAGFMPLKHFLHDMLLELPQAQHQDLPIHTD